MATLWTERDEQWNGVEIAGAAASVAFDGDTSGAALVRGETEALGWALIAPANCALRVNGESLALGIRILRDRDAVQFGDGRVAFFSTESAPAVVAFNENRTVACARCKVEIKRGEAAVRCPRCNVWHHQADNSKCWSYAERCAGCDQQPTDLDRANVWSPEGL